MPQHSIKLSANLGFLWTELPFIDAIHRAAEFGFNAVECHWPYSVEAHKVKQALEDTGLAMLSLNTLPGNLEEGDFGICALPNRQDEARDYIQQAIEYAHSTSTKNVHVMAGKSANVSGAKTAFLENLHFAAELAKKYGVGVVIEPINRKDVPHYFLSKMESAVDIVNELQHDNLKIMFDCYHIQITQGNLKYYLKKYLSLIEHIQIAGVPNRAEPDEGDINYPELLAYLEKLGYYDYIGAEYKPRTTTESGLSWLELYR